MGKRWSSILLVVLLLGLSSSPLVESPLDDIELVAFSSSNLALSFTNGPDSNEDITGLHSLTFGMTGDANVSSLLLEISSDGNAWTTVKNITSAPWLTYFDSTAYSNDSYTLRATAWDDDVNEAVVASSGTFNIVNQVPVITIFTALNAAVGTGSSASDRAWFDIETDGTLAYRWGASDDPTDSHCTCTQTPLRRSLSERWG